MRGVLRGCPPPLLNEAVHSTHAVLPVINADVSVPLSVYYFD